MRAIPGTNPNIAIRLLEHEAKERRREAVAREAQLAAFPDDYPGELHLDEARAIAAVRREAAELEAAADTLRWDAMEKRAGEKR